MCFHPQADHGPVRSILALMFFLACTLGAKTSAAQMQVCNAPVVAILGQFQADNFACSEVTGDLFISDNGSGELLDLSGLSILTAIEGDLTIQSNPALASLSGLENLRSVGGNVRIGNSLFGGNNAITSLAGLDGLTSVGGFISILHNEALENFSGLGALEVDGIEAIQISSNPSLTSLVGLGISGALDGAIRIQDNAALTSLVGLDGLTEVENVLIARNDSLQSLAGLQNVRSMPGTSFNVSENRALVSLAGLEGLNSLGGTLTLGRNDALESLEGLENLVSLESLNITSNAALESIASLGRLTSADGISISSNGALGSLAGLEGLTAVAEEVQISNNFVLQTLEGLRSLTSAGALAIQGNTLLTTFRGLENLRSLGGLVVIESPGLESLAGLERVARVDGSVQIFSNPLLTSLSGLDGLTEITGDAMISFHSELASIEALSELTSVGGTLIVSGNSMLQTLDGLESLDSTGLDLIVSGNDRLVDCACGLAGLVSGVPPTFSGVPRNADIRQNDPNGFCTSPEVVLSVPLSSCANLNTAPVAEAGPDLRLEAENENGVMVMLDGTGSFDADGDVLEFVWTLGGVEIATGERPTVVLPAGTQVLTLTVTDPNGSSDSDDVVVTIALSRPLECDANSDRAIDVDDIRAIFELRGRPASGPADPLDVNDDGLITINDGRLCVLQCDNPRCVPTP